MLVGPGLSKDPCSKRLSSDQMVENLPSIQYVLGDGHKAINLRETKEAKMGCIMT